MERFTELVDQLIAYGHSTDPMYYTIRFIDGLRDEIHSTVPVQRPPTLDTACSLAKLQEEVADPARRRDSCRPDAGLQWKHPPPCIPLQLPAPPPSTAAAVADDNRGPVAGRPDVDKFSALKSYRRARVLYDKCAEQWRLDHQCAPTVHLHMIQELMDLLKPTVHLQFHLRLGKCCPICGSVTTTAGPAYAPTGPQRLSRPRVPSVRVSGHEWIRPV